MRELMAFESIVKNQQMITCLPIIHELLVCVRDRPFKFFLFFPKPDISFMRNTNQII